jgi:SpoVK/Ycf46/Vps4 family AAA+-type ATPase
VRIDPSLDEAVTAFVEALAPVLESIVDRLDGSDPTSARQDVIVEAYNLCCAFIDADELATDDELWALIGAFSSRLDTQLIHATPADVRQAGLTSGARAFLTRPSTMFEILLGVDARDGTRHARTYYERAIDLGFTVASLDLQTSRTELMAIERYRGMLLDAIHRMKDGSTGPTEATRASGSKPPGRVQPGAIERDAEQPGVQGAPSEPLTPPRPLDELLAELDGLVGMDSVKEEVKLVTNLIRVQNLRRARQLPVIEQSRHLIFTGNPGTGKTTVARLLAQIYRTLGVVERGHLVETDRAGLVAGYVGQTATKVTAVFDSADGGVLLIDEAYALVRGGEQDFGREAIDTIVKLAEDRRDRLVVIAAGYPDEMASFVDANPGLRSRFPKTIFFPDYTTDELVQIFRSLCDRAHYRPDEPALAAVREWLDAQPRVKGFGNGRLVRNLFEAAVARQAGRVLTSGDPTDEELVTLTAADIPPIGEGPGTGVPAGAATP